MSSTSLSAQLRVLLFAVHRLPIDALHKMIETDADCTVVGKATSINEILSLLPTVQPSFIVADLDSCDGLNVVLAEQLTKLNNGIPIVALTHYTRVELLYQLLPFNFQALLTKDIDGLEFIKILKLLKDWGGKKFCRLPLLIACCRARLH